MDKGIKLVNINDEFTSYFNQGTGKIFMLKTKKNSIAILIVLSVVGVVLSTRYSKQNELPHILMPTIESGVLYDVSMTSSDLPTLRRGVGVEQYYHILLKAGISYKFTSHVDWLGMEAHLYADDGKQIGEMECAYRARCDFYVTPKKDTWGLLRIVGNYDAVDTDKKFTLEVGESASLYGSTPPPNRTITLRPGTLPVINSNIYYTGTVSQKDVPFYKSGEGSIQNYSIHLPAGQKVQAIAKSSGFDISLQILDADRVLVSRFSEEDKRDACLQVTPPKEGMYILRVMTRNLDNLKTPGAGDFTLEVSTNDKISQPCT